MATGLSTSPTAAGIAVAPLWAFDTECIPSEFLAVELLNHSISDFFVIDVCEAEAPAGTGFTVENGLEANPLPNAGELSFKLLALKILRQIADVKTHAHETGKGNGRLRVRPIVVVTARAVNHRTHPGLSEPLGGTTRIGLRSAPARELRPVHTHAQGSSVESDRPKWAQVKSGGLPAGLCH